MNIRLEYSVAEGKFKQVPETDRTNSAKGYKTLCCFLLEERATRFTQAMLIKYPQLNSRGSQCYPSLLTLREEVYEFVKEDMKVMEEQMNRIYKRRVQLFNKE